MIVDHFAFWIQPVAKTLGFLQVFMKGYHLAPIQNMLIGRDTSQLGDETLASIPLQNELAYT